jgi:hypothetical protein
MRLMCALFGLSALLCGQDRYTTLDKDGDVCPRLVLDGPIKAAGSRAYGTTGGQRGAGAIGEMTWQTGVQFIPTDQRKDVSRFAAVDESGKAYPMSDYRGRVLVVGLWSVSCQPSLYLLGEMAELNGKGAKAGFELFPVNYDSERWRVIEKFVRQSRMQTELKGVKIYTPGLGSQGVNNFMDQIPALPTYFIIDRQGRVAVQGTGYKDGDLVRWLKKILVEPAAPTPAQEVNTLQSNDNTGFRPR